MTVLDSCSRARAPALALGIGCMRNTALATLEAAVDAALRDLGPVAVSTLASIERKRDEPALRQLAHARGWALRFFSAAELAPVRVARPSPRLARALGSASVAEAAALLAAATNSVPGGSPRLLIDKQAHRGADGKWVTIAVAWSGPAAGLE